jgi:hypothetical protein
MQKMREDLPPFQELRRRMSVGRPTEVHHTPLSGVTAAEAELTRLEKAIAERGMKCLSQVAIVVKAKDRPGFAGILRPVDHSAQTATKLITEFASLKEPTIAGLVYCIVDPKTGNFEFWTKAFVKGREIEKVLDLAVADGMNRMEGKGKPGNYSA